MMKRVLTKTCFSTAIVSIACLGISSIIPTNSFAGTQSILDKTPIKLQFVQKKPEGMPICYKYDINVYYHNYNEGAFGCTYSPDHQASFVNTKYTPSTLTYYEAKQGHVTIEYGSNHETINIQNCKYKKTGTGKGYVTYYLHNSNDQWGNSTLSCSSTAPN